MFERWFSHCKQTAEKYIQICENWKKLLSLEPILDLLICGQKCTVSILQPFDCEFEASFPKYSKTFNVEFNMIDGDREVLSPKSLISMYL